MKTRPLWCIAKSASIREEPYSDSPELGRVKFGRQVSVSIENYEVINGRIKCTYRDSQFNGRKPTITGWVLLKALTNKRIDDYSCLYFNNLTGKRLPVMNRMSGEVTGHILPGEQVVVAAKVGDMCVTNKGWTRFEWLTKDREIFDHEGISVLLYGVLEWAVKDYKSILRQIKMYKYKDRTEFIELMDELENIILWFISDEYAMMFDSVPGRERLDDMNDEIGVDKKWLKDKFRIRDAITEKRKKKVKTRSDSGRRHT